MGKGDNRKSHKETKKPKKDKEAKPLSKPIPFNPEKIIGAYLTRFHDKAIPLLHITIVVLGDIVVFVTYVLFGKVEHGVTLSQAFFRTTLPFGVVWLAGSPWLGTYSASTLYDPKTTIWKIPLSWLLCGSGGS